MRSVKTVQAAISGWRDRPALGGGQTKVVLPEMVSFDHVVLDSIFQKLHAANSSPSTARPALEASAVRPRWMVVEGCVVVNVQNANLETNLGVREDEAPGVDWMNITLPTLPRKLRQVNPSSPASGSNTRYR